MENLSPSAAKPSSNIPEKTVQKMILKYLRLRSDIFAWRVNTGAIHLEDRFVKFGFKGMADILGVMKGGQILAIEVKSTKGRPTKEQMFFGQQITAMGGIYILARSIDDVISGLEAYYGESA